MEAQPGVAALVWNEAEALLLHRRLLGGGWAPPSGRVEPGESILDALRRELHEETALEITVERLVGVYSDPSFQVVRYQDGSVTHFFTSLFSVAARGILRGSAEGAEWRWCDPSSPPAPLLPYAHIWLRDGLADSESPYVR